MKILTVVLAACLVASACASSTSPPSATPHVTPTASPVLTPTAAVSATARPTSTPTATVPAATMARLIGQKLVVRMEGTTPSADLLGRIRRGEVGGIILFSFNITTPAALSALSGELKAAAVAGGQPRLIIAVDQEGGATSRISWAPPTLSAPQMGLDGRAATAAAQGASTGAALAAHGIDIDLAPVADVPASSASFMERDGRTFSSDADLTAQLADAFASGLESAGVIPTMKHFPGIGFATKNTDSSLVRITASADGLAPGLEPYRTAIANDIPLIMLSNATYSAYDPANAAGWSAAIATKLLRQDLGYTGATITDSLDGTAFARGLSDSVLAVRAAAAGTDMVLVTGTEAVSTGVYARLLAGAEDGTIPLAALQASYDRILALKARL